MKRDFAVYIKPKEVHCHQLLQASIPTQCDTRTELEAAAARPSHGHCTGSDDAEDQDDDYEVHLQDTLKELEAVWGEKFAWHRELAELSFRDKDVLKKHFRMVNTAGGFWHASQLKFLHMLMHEFGRTCKHIVTGLEVTSDSHQV